MPKKLVKRNKQRTHSLLSWGQKSENVGTLSSSKSDNLAEASRSSEKSYEVAEEIIISESTTDEDESNFSEGSHDTDDEIDEEDRVINAFQNIITSNASDEELLNQLEKLELQRQENIPNIEEEQEVTTKDIAEEETNEVIHAEENGGVVTTSDNMVTHPLYPPGRILHIVPALSSENSNSNDHDSEQKHLYLYETSKQLYGKLRVSKRMIFDHMSKKYLKMLQKLINQLENEHSQHRG